MIVTMNAIALDLPIAFPLPLHVIGSTQCHYAQLSSGRRGKLISIRDYKVPLFMEAGFAVIALPRTYVRLSRPEATVLVQDDPQFIRSTHRRGRTGAEGRFIASVAN